MPGVLAHEHREPSPRRVERANVVSAFDETLLVEDAVGGKEVLPMHVANYRRIAAELHPHRAVVEDAVPQLVEADRDLDRARARIRCQIHSLEIGRERSGRASLLAHTALEE